MRIFPFVLAATETTAQEECIDEEVRVECESSCQEGLIRCLAACNHEHNCSSDCNRAYSNCTYHCPCNLGCPSGCGDGCPHQLCQCRQPELDEHYIECESRAQAEFDTCIVDCHHDILCDIVCELDYVEALKDCPCQVNCPNGCPCPNYQCDSSTPTTSTSGMIYTTTSTTVYTTTTAVRTTTTDPDYPPFSTTSDLATTTYHKTTTTSTTTTESDGTLSSVLHLNSFETNPSYIRNNLLQNGGELLTSQIEYGEGAEVYGSCSCLIAGQMMIFGGAQQPRQVSRLNDCRLEVRDQLRIYDFAYGACHPMTAMSDEWWVLLCFSFGFERDCVKYNIVTKANEGQVSTHHSHSRTRMAMFGGEMIGDELLATRLLVVGDYGGHNKAELFYNYTWFETLAWPFSDTISMYAATTVNRKAYIFGGLDGYNYLTTIATFDGSTWSAIGQLVHGRHAHGVISVGQMAWTNGFVIVGGAGDNLSEECRLVGEGDEIECYTVGPVLTNYAWYPELFPVTHNYCV